MSLSYLHVHHLWLRAGFGGTPSQIQSRMQLSREALVEELMENSRQFSGLKTVKDPVRGKQVCNIALLFMILRSTEQMNQLNLEWLRKMSTTKAQLREKMTFFWHNHFATSTPLAWLMQLQNNKLRMHALGNFKTLLHEIARDPAMIIYLNNQQNKKEQPNENFAREVLELFTLGRDTLYTEQDIKEAARAFTGWQVNRKGQFEIVAEEHDDGEKTFLGKTGNWDGTDIIDIILEHKEVADFIAGKLYREMVNVEPHPLHIAELSHVFYSSGWNIGATLEYMFLQDWFYAAENIGAHIASPVELLVRYHKLISLTTKSEREMLRLQKYLGQVLMFPPNVAGWPGGRAWIDASSLTIRQQMPWSILKDGHIEVELRPGNEDDPLGNDQRRSEKNAAVKSDWNTLVQFFSATPQDQLTTAIASALLTVQPAGEVWKLVEPFIEKSTKDRQIITTCAAVMSLPEFQLH